jgi:hypothetical protein
MSIKESFELQRRSIEVLFPASTAMDIGDLLWLNSGVAAKASAIADLGTLALNQADFRSKFLGVNAQKRLATDTSADYRGMVLPECICYCDCDSATFTLGSLVGIARSATPLNENQKVVGVTSPTLAIGRVLKAEPVAVTKVLCLLSAWEFGTFVGGPVGGVGSSQAARCTTQFDAVTGTTGTTLTNIVGLSLNVLAGASYAFEAYLAGVATTNSGVKFAIGGTATATSISYAGAQTNGTAINANTVTTTLGAAVAGATTVWTNGHIRGTIVVNAGGTLTVQAAQNAAHADTTSVYVNSHFNLTRIA